MPTFDDPLQKTYFKSLCGTGDAFQIGIRPRPSAQRITLGTSRSDTVVKSWGLHVGQ